MSDNSKNQSLTNKDLLKLIKSSNLNESTKRKINELVKIDEKKEKSKIKKVNYDKLIKSIDKSSDKYKIALKLINKLLENMGKQQIDDLKKFKNINKNDIITEINKKTFNDLEEEIFMQFDKTRCGWYRRNTINNYLLSFLRCMCLDVGLKLVHVNKEKNVNGVIENFVLYSIIDL